MASEAFRASAILRRLAGPPVREAYHRVSLWSKVQAPGLDRAQVRKDSLTGSRTRSSCVLLSGHAESARGQLGPLRVYSSQTGSMASPGKIQLYSFATPNGKKIGIALEEMGIAYEPHIINISKGDQHTPEFLAINPNGKIPAIVDPDGPGGKPLAVFESGAILLYLAEKSGKFLSSDPVHRWETMEWLFFQVGGVGPMFGQFGAFFKFLKDKCDHPLPLERYSTESKRLLEVLEKRLEGREFLIDSGYSIADMATFPWVQSLRDFYNAGYQLELSKFPEVFAWVDRCAARPLTAKGLTVCSL